MKAITYEKYGPPDVLRLAAVNLSIPLHNNLIANKNNQIAVTSVKQIIPTHTHAYSQRTSCYFVCF